MSFNATDTAMGAVLVNSFGELVTYRRCNGEVVTGIYAEIDLGVEIFGRAESGAAEYRNEALLLRADVGEPRRGDTIITADGTTYTVQDLLPGASDKVEIKVSVK